MPSSGVRKFAELPRDAQQAVTGLLGPDDELDALIDEACDYVRHNPE